MINVRDLDSVRAARPFLVAHRGGVIAEDAPENSVRAIELAAEHGYAMVELDLTETADDEPILMHGRLQTNCGVAKKAIDLTSHELTALRYRGSDQRVITLAQGVETCASLGLGVMLDFKLRRDPAQGSYVEPSAVFLQRTAALVRSAGLENSAVAISDMPALRKHLEDVTLFPVRFEDIQRLFADDRIPLDGQFWFGWAEELPSQAVPRLHATGAFAIVSINAFHYPIHAHDTLAREDIERLLDAGVDGFQIDCVYERHFKRPPAPSNA